MARFNPLSAIELDDRTSDLPLIDDDFDGSGLDDMIDGAYRTLFVAFSGGSHEVMQLTEGEPAETDGQRFTLHVDAMVHAEYLANLPPRLFEQRCEI